MKWLIDDIGGKNGIAATPEAANERPFSKFEGSLNDGD